MILLGADRPCMFILPTAPAKARRRKSHHQWHHHSCSHLPGDEMHRQEQCWRRRGRQETTLEMSQLLQLPPRNAAGLLSGFLFSFVKVTLHTSHLLLSSFLVDVPRVSCTHLLLSFFGTALQSLPIIRACLPSRA